MRERINLRRHQDHGVIGWISTTDAMLLGMTLMFTLAIFIQSKYLRADKGKRPMNHVLENSQRVDR